MTVLTQTETSNTKTAKAVMAEAMDAAQLPRYTGLGMCFALSGEDIFWGMLYASPAATKSGYVIPEKFKRATAGVLLLGTFTPSQYDTLVDLVRTFRAEMDGSSWARSTRRQWVSEHYTVHHRESADGRVSPLHPIDPCIGRVMEIAWLLGGEPDVSCAGHPNGAYFRMFAHTPESQRMVDVLEAMRCGDDPVWKVERGPCGLLVNHPAGDTVVTVHMAVDVTTYEERDEYLKATVSELESVLEIYPDQIPTPPEGVWRML